MSPLSISCHKSVLPKPSLVRKLLLTYIQYMTVALSAINHPQLSKVYKFNKIFSKKKKRNKTNAFFVTALLFLYPPTPVYIVGNLTGFKYDFEQVHSKTYLEIINPNYLGFME